MITLHKAIVDIKALIKWGMIMLFIILIVVFVLRILPIVFPQTLPAPESKFGTLPKITFPSSITEKQFIYALDTLTGNLPQFPTSIEVHRIQRPEPNLLALKRAQERFSPLGFTGSPTALSDTDHVWQKADPITQWLTFNILSSDFILKSEYINHYEVLGAQDLGDEKTAIEESEKFLSSVRPEAADLDKGKTRTTLFSIQNGTLIPSTSLSTAQIIRVEFFQKSVKDIPIVYPNPQESPMLFLVGTLEKNPGVVEAHFSYQSVANDSSTYAVKTSDQAYNDLKNGDGYIASYFGEEAYVTIDNIFIAYYIGERAQEFLIPIIVFEGSNGFVAYVEAISH